MISLSNLYRREKFYQGVVRCFCCGLPVTVEDASREHKWPKSLGGSNDVSNLSISHKQCNFKRSNGIATGEVPKDKKIYATFGQYKITCEYIAKHAIIYTRNKKFAL